VADYNLFAADKNCFIKHSAIHSDLVLDSCPEFEPLVSIIIPTFRRPELLRQAIDSAVSQSCSVSYEIIVVDNERDPAWAEAVDAICRASLANCIRLYRNGHNLGMFGNWNRGVELARGEWLTILSDDDVLLPAFIQTAWDCRAGNAMVVGETVKLSSPREYRASSAGDLQVTGVRLDDLMVGNVTPGLLGALVSRRMVLSIGGFDEDLWPVSDYVFNAKYWTRCGIRKVNREFAIYRWLENESQKVAALQGTVENDMRMKIDLLDYLGCSGLRRHVADFLLRKQSSYTALVVCPSVNSKFDAAESMRKLDVRGTHVFAWVITMLKKGRLSSSMLRTIRRMLWMAAVRGCREAQGESA